MFKRSHLVLLIVLIAAGLGLMAVRLAQTAPTPSPQTLQNGYETALERARNGLPGAARVLYQQLARDDLSSSRRARLYRELPNYPSPQALKLADGDLHHAALAVRHAAIDAVTGLVPAAQLSLVLGPLLDDPEQSIRFQATRALLGLSPDELGLFFGRLQAVLDEYIQALEQTPDDSAAQLQLARLYLYDADYPQAARALERVQLLAPDNLEALAIRVQVMEKLGQGDAARQMLAEQLQRNPQSAFLQHQLGLWLLAHDQGEYALLALAKAVELQGDNVEYRYRLATTLHDLEQVDAAQVQLDEIVRQHPANRRARVLLIQYWKETGQLQNVQIRLAELEQQNPDDPVLQQGL